MRGIAAAIGLLAFSAVAQTNYVTNWIAAPPNYRVISNQVYNADTSQKWVTVRIGPELSFSHAAGGWPAPGQRGWVGGSVGDNGVTIQNYPFSPSEFTHDKAANVQRPALKNVRVYPLYAITNWNPDGSVKGVIRVYDYGLAPTNKIPIVTIRR